MSLTPGTRLGPYDLQSRLGGGGMGEVWKAYDPKLQRTVAIKVLHETDDAASRILAEARAASALDHPHICTVYEVGEHDGVAFIVMAYVEGQPLSELIPSDGLPPEGFVNLPAAARSSGNSRSTACVSGGARHPVPFGERLRPEETMVGGPEQMAADPKEILHDAVDRREALELPRGLEAAHLPFALSRRFVRDLGSVVGVRSVGWTTEGITVRQAAP